MVNNLSTDSTLHPKYHDDDWKAQCWDQQVGGDHYSKLKIQPLEYALANDLGIMEHAVVKYTTRHQDKGGAQDIRKGIDYLIKILKHKYNEDY